jgi:hypothetical protein
MIGGSPVANRHWPGQSFAEPAEYFERALTAAAAACERRDAIVRRINLGGGRCGVLHFCDEALEEVLYPALAHQELREERNEPDFKILAWDSLHSGVPMWSPPWTTGDYLSRGEIAGYNDERFRVVFNLDSGVLSFYDADRQIGLWWTQDFAQLPLYERAAPFLLLFHWWHALRREGSFLLHAAAIGTKNGGGLLLAGRSGSGKSTTALASLLDHEWFYVADDYCVVRAEAEGATVHSLYCSVKLDAKMLANFPSLSHSVSSPDGWRDPQGKVLLDLHRFFPNRLRMKLALRAILLPRVSEKSSGAQANRFMPAGTGAAVRALAPSTLFQLPGAGSNNFRLIVALTNQLPCFELELGSEPAVVPQSLREFIESLRSWDKSELV